MTEVVLPTPTPLATGEHAFHTATKTFIDEAGRDGAKVGNKLGESVNVKDFGAVGNGIADDTVAIQAAFDSLGPHQAQRTYFFPKGRYKVTSTLTATVNKWGMRLLGEGGKRNRWASDLSEQAGGAVLRAETPGMTLMQFDDITNGGPVIENLHFEEPTFDQTATLLHMRNTSHWTLRDCVFQGAEVAFLADADDGDASWGLVDQCVFSDSLASVRTTNAGAVQVPSIVIRAGAFMVPDGGVGVDLTDSAHCSRLLGVKFDVGDGATGIRVDGSVVGTQIAACSMETHIGATATLIHIGNDNGSSRGTVVSGGFLASNANRLGTGILVSGSSGAKATQVSIVGTHVRAFDTGIKLDHATKCVVVGATTHDCAVGIETTANATANRLVACNGDVNAADYSIAGTGNDREVVGIANTAAATTPGTVTKKLEVFDASGASLGFVPIYDAIT